MLHAREDYNRIQDPEEKIAKDEPVFLLRAKDKLAPNTVRQWAAMCYENGRNDEGERAMQWATEMEIWQTKNPSKLPDL